MLAVVVFFSNWDFLPFPLIAQRKYKCLSVMSTNSKSKENRKEEKLGRKTRCTALASRPY
jgi:hypothetical protein